MHSIPYKHASYYILHMHKHLVVKGHVTMQ